MLKYRKIYYSFSGLLVVASIISIAVFGLDLGTDFKGGSIMELRFGGNIPSHESIEQTLVELELGEVVIQDSGARGMILRFRHIDEALHQAALTKLTDLAEFEELRFESIGPIIGEETKRKALWAMSLVLVMILVYIAWAFRKITFPLSSWKYGVVAIFTLFHDILITVGIFALLGHLLNLDVGIPFVAALLTILGYSVNDTIVVFDRIRENVLAGARDFNFGDVINQSLKQTYMRSLNTSLTTFFVLLAVFLFGGATIKYFVLTLMIGIAAGTYSSIFLASPLLFSWSLVKYRR